MLQLELVGHDFFVFRNADERRGQRRLPPARRRLRPDRADGLEPGLLAARAAARAARARGRARPPRPGRHAPALGRGRHPRRRAAARVGRGRDRRGASSRATRRASSRCPTGRSSSRTGRTTSRRSPRRSSARCRRRTAPRRCAATADTWAVAARRIGVVELPDRTASELELTVGPATAASSLVDGEPQLRRARPRSSSSSSGGTATSRATRLDGDALGGRGVSRL